MFDRIGSLKILERDTHKVLLTLSGATRSLGVVFVVVGLLMTAKVWAISSWLAVLTGSVAAFGALLLSLRRDFVFDKEAGVLRIDHSMVGIPHRQVVPLFHLRAVVIVANPDLRLAAAGKNRYVAYIDRRVGEAIYLDEASKSARLFKLAEAISEVAELRLEYDADPAEHSAG